MRHVDQAVVRPFRCAVIPYLGNKNALGGFIDTGQSLDREHVYISLEAAVELAKFIGWTGPSAVKAKDDEIVALRSRIEQLEAEVREADKFAESAEYTLARFGQKVQRKPGRPKKETPA
jgi:hypothetical protein